MTLATVEDKMADQKKPPPGERPKFWTTFELAEKANCAPVTIYRAIKDKKIRARRTPGGHYRIDNDEAEAFLRAGGWI